MTTGPKAGLYQNAESASYLPPTLRKNVFIFLGGRINHWPAHTALPVIRIVLLHKQGDRVIL